MNKLFGLALEALDFTVRPILCRVRIGGSVGLRDLHPSRDELRRSIPAMLRGTIIGSLCSLIPGTGPTIASFISYAAEKKVSKTPEKFGTGMIEGVACPEASNAFVRAG